MAETRIVRDLAAADYQRVKALSASAAFTLIDECPAVFRHESPWNPDFEPEPKPEFDLGQAAHLAILEPRKLAAAIRIIDAEDWRSKKAREERDLARAAALVPLLPAHLEQVERIAGALRANRWAADLLDGAEVEVSYFWTAEGVPCKARADIVPRGGGALADLKTAASANPRAFERAAWDQGHFLRVPWYMDGWKWASGEHIADYWFIVVGKKEPHPVTVARLDERAIEWGRLVARRARALFRRCVRDNDWPGYAREPVTLSLPTWAEYRLADDEASGVLSSDDVLRSMEFLTP